MIHLAKLLALALPALLLMSCDKDYEKCEYENSCRGDSVVVEDKDKEEPEYDNSRGSKTIGILFEAKAFRTERVASGSGYVYDYDYIYTYITDIGANKIMFKDPILGAQSFTGNKLFKVIWMTEEELRDYFYAYIELSYNDEWVEEAQDRLEGSRVVGEYVIDGVYTLSYLINPSKEVESLLTGDYYRFMYLNDYDYSEYNRIIKGIKASGFEVIEDMLIWSGSDANNAEALYAPMAIKFQSRHKTMNNE